MIEVPPLVVVSSLLSIEAEPRSVDAFGRGSGQDISTGHSRLPFGESGGSHFGSGFLLGGWVSRLIASYTPQTTCHEPLTTREFQEIDALCRPISSSSS